MLEELKKILIIEAHPDDIELSMGMTLCRLADHGARIELVVCTDGNVNGDAKHRLREAQTACEVLGIKTVHHLGFRDGELRSHYDALANKVETLLDNGYDAVFLHSLQDRHQDHRTVAQVGKLLAEPLSMASNIFCFESPSVLPHFSPEMFVLGDKNMAERKEQLMDLHKSQIAQKRIFSLRRARSSLAYWGERVMPYRHDVYAEAFEVVSLAKLPSHDGHNLVVGSQTKGHDVARELVGLLGESKTILAVPHSDGVRGMVAEIEQRIEGNDIQSLFIPKHDDLGYAAIAAVREHPANIFVYSELNGNATVRMGDITLGVEQVVIE